MYIYGPRSHLVLSAPRRLCIQVEVRAAPPSIVVKCGGGGSSCVRL